MARDTGNYAAAYQRFQEALDIGRTIGDRDVELDVLRQRALLAHQLGDNEAACADAEQALQLLQDVEDQGVQAEVLLVLGHALAGLGRTADAADAYTEARARFEALGHHHRTVEPLAGLARVALAQGDIARARAQVEDLLSALETGALKSADEPFRIPLTCYQVLQAAGDARGKEVLARACEHLQEQAARIADEQMRQAFLEKVPYHQQLLAACSLR